MQKVRLDMLLVDQGFAETRQKSKGLILAQKVFVDGMLKDKCGTLVSGEAVITLLEADRYVGRGGIKLESALSRFNVSLEGKVGLDAGASTGGFTDCLLQHGIDKVYAVDVGYGQLAWKLRNDSRVVVVERSNIRYLKVSDIDEKADLAVLDLSFISLRLVLPNIYQLLTETGEIIALIKPQFEVGKGEVGKGGVVRDPQKQQAVIEEVAASAEKCGFINTGVIDSPLTGAKGNKEYFISLKKRYVETF